MYSSCLHCTSWAFRSEKERTYMYIHHCVKQSLIRFIRNPVLFCQYGLIRENTVFSKNGSRIIPYWHRSPIQGLYSARICVNGMPYYTVHNIYIYGDPNYSVLISFMKTCPVFSPYLCNRDAVIYRMHKSKHKGTCSFMLTFAYTV